MSATEFLLGFHRPPSKKKKITTSCCIAMNFLFYLLSYPAVSSCFLFLCIVMQLSVGSSRPSLRGIIIPSTPILVRICSPECVCVSNRTYCTCKYPWDYIQLNYLNRKIQGYKISPLSQWIKAFELNVQIIPGLDSWILSLMYILIWNILKY